jgi:hypothetical protein
MVTSASPRTIHGIVAEIVVEYWQLPITEASKEHEHLVEHDSVDIVLHNPAPRACVTIGNSRYLDPVANESSFAVHEALHLPTFVGTIPIEQSLQLQVFVIVGLKMKFFSIVKQKKTIFFMIIVCTMVLVQDQGFEL